MNTNINKFIIHKFILFLFPIIFIFISGCSFLGLEPSDEIVQETVRVCANSCTPPTPDSSGASGQLLWAALCKMKGEAKITDFKITNNWKKTIDNETVYFYETKFKMIYSKVDVGELHYPKSCYSSEATVKLVKRGKKWYSITSSCADERSEIDCGNEASETLNTSAQNPTKTTSENQKEDPCKKVYEFYSDCVEGGNIDNYPSCRADDRIFSYYSSVYDRKNFFNTCDTSIINNTKIDYASFKKNICKEVKETPQAEGTPAKGTPLNNDNEIQTKFGSIKLQRIEEDYSLNIIINGKKVYTMKEAGDHPTFNERSYEIGDDRLFFINTSAGNSAEWSYMVLERKNGLFISDPKNSLTYVGGGDEGLYINGNEFIIIESIKYGKDQIITYKNGTLMQKGDYDEKNAFDFDLNKIKQIQLIKIY